MNIAIEPIINAVVESGADIENLFRKSFEAGELVGELVGAGELAREGELAGAGELTGELVGAGELTGELVGEGELTGELVGAGEAGAGAGSGSLPPQLVTNLLPFMFTLCPFTSTLQMFICKSFEH